MGTLLDTRTTKGDLVLDFRRKSLVDYGANQNDASASGCYFSDNHGIVHGSSGVVTIADADSLQFTDFTMIFRFDSGITKQTSNEYLYDKRDAGGAQLSVYITATGVTIYDGTNTRTAARNLIGVKDLCVYGSATGTPKLAIGGLYDSDFSGALTVSVNDAPLLIGSAYGGGSVLGSALSYALVAPELLSESDIVELTDLIANDGFETRSKSTVLPSLEPDSKETGLVLAPSIINDNEWLSNKGPNGTIYGASPVPTQFGQGVRSYSSGGYVNYGSDLLDGVTDNFALTAIAKTDGTTKTLWGRRSGSNSHIHAYIRSTGLFSFYNGTAEYTSVVANDGDYHVFTVLQKSGNLYLIVDGVVYDKGAVTITNYTTDLLFCAWDDTPQSFWDGIAIPVSIYANASPDNVQEWAIREYKKALSACQIFGYNIKTSISAQTGFIEDSNIVSDVSCKIIEERWLVDDRSCPIKALEAQAAGNIDLTRVFAVADYPYLYGYYDDGSGYAYGEISHINGVVTMASGDKIALASEQLDINLRVTILPEI